MNMSGNRTPVSPTAPGGSGTVRAAVLEALVTPASTGELAAKVDVTPGAISQHVSVLRGCDLVTSHRSGRRVFHSLTETGEALVRGAEYSVGRVV